LIYLFNDEESVPHPPMGLFTFCEMTAQCNILGWRPKGGYDPEIRTLARFLYNAPTDQVSSS